MTAGRSESGAATVLAVALAGLLLFLGVALGAVATLVADHRRAGAAADLAALAGADVLTAGGADPCEVAARIATANGARLTACSTTGADVAVRTSVDTRGWRSLVPEVEGFARAGPVRSAARRRAGAPPRPCRAWPPAR